jgi:LPS O-antigen subunit length determinant protein (WzzB/FepE family)
MNKKWLIIGVVSVAVIGTLAYLYVRKKKKSSDTNNSSETNTDLINLKKSSSVDNNSQAVKITEKKLSQFNDTLSHYEYKNNSLYDKDTGSKISENAGWAVWGLLYRNYNSLLNGVKNDNSINQETKEYAYKVLEEIKKTIERVFPPNVYNRSSELFKKYNLDKIKESNIYNEKI